MGCFKLTAGLNKKVEQAVTFEGIAVFVEAADGETCERCWTVTTTVGSHAEHPTLCTSCAETVQNYYQEEGTE